ncbi:MAG: hypothetical protein AAFQ66_13455 [Pseudomonadota bacterium]
MPDPDVDFQQRVKRIVGTDTRENRRGRRTVRAGPLDYFSGMLLALQVPLALCVGLVAGFATRCAGYHYGAPRLYFGSGSDQIVLMATDIPLGIFFGLALTAIFRLTGFLSIVGTMSGLIFFLLAEASLASQVPWLWEQAFSRRYMLSLTSSLGALAR